MFALDALKGATSLGDVARLLNFKPKALSYILYIQPEAEKYATFQIPKRSGGQRTINAPIDALKLVQRRLSDLLQDCVDEINIKGNRRDRIAHGFKRGRSIITNATEHRHRRYVFNLDLEDFFPSINLGRVRGFLIKNRDFGLHKDVATVLAQIACHDNSIPQGSPCSPIISNLVAHILDIRLVSLASAAGCTYSRYADDLTFSTNKKVFPLDVAVPVGNGGEFHLWIPSEKLRSAVERSGFRINTAKTHLMYRTSRQVVTGLVVNEKISVPADYRRNVRAMVHSLVRTGVFEIYGLKHKDGQVAVEKRPGSLNELHGMLGFVDSVDVYNRNKVIDCSRDGVSARERVYKEFLIYSNFYAAERPVVICEGETDNIYLTHAIRSLASEFPDLAEVDGKKIHLKVRLFKYAGTSTARILGLNDGGSGVLSQFIADYRQSTTHFTAPGMKSPVVILYDNDSGASRIKNTIKNVSKGQGNGAGPYVHIIKNLYAVPTPLVGDETESKIENCFDAAIKGTVIDRKTFNDVNKFDIEKHYGKKVFAHRVVRAKADTIDFTGFRQLLTNLVAVINVHKTQAVESN